MTLPSYQPTRSEMEEHAVTHTPYRPWCTHCAEGKGQEVGHFRKRDRDPSRVPLISFDYAGVSDNGEFVDALKVDWESDGICRVLVVALRTSDDAQNCIFGHVVPRKGIDLDR